MKSSPVTGMLIALAVPMAAAFSAGLRSSVTSSSVPPVCRLAVLRTGNTAPADGVSLMWEPGVLDAAQGLVVDRDAALAAPSRRPAFGSAFR